MDFLAVPVAPFPFSIVPASAPSISQQPRPRRLNPPSSPSTPPPWAASGPPWSALASEPASKTGIIGGLGRGILDTRPGAQHHAQRDWAGATMGSSTSGLGELGWRFDRERHNRFSRQGSCPESRGEDILHLHNALVLVLVTEWRAAGGFARSGPCA